MENNLCEILHLPLSSKFLTKTYMLRIYIPIWPKLILYEFWATHSPTS